MWNVIIAVMTMLWNGRSGVRIPARKEILLFFKTSKPNLGSQRLLFIGYRDSFPWVKAAGA
jgi:hypothetical protein